MDGRDNTKALEEIRKLLELIKNAEIDINEWYDSVREVCRLVTELDEDLSTEDSYLPNQWVILKEKQNAAGYNAYIGENWQ